MAHVAISALPNNAVTTGPTYPVTGLMCLFGIFLHLFLSSPIMDMMGIHYTDENGSIWEKQHIGSFFIILSFFTLLGQYRNPIRAFASIYKSERIYTACFGAYVLILTYMICRSGAKGLSFLLDTQICAILAALVLSFTPVSYCRKAIIIFIAFSAANSVIGIGEGVFQQRLFVLDETVSGMKETFFRASAWLGHPLNSAMFTGVMVFVVLGTRLSLVIKTLVCALLCASLVPFGGRSAILITVAGLGWLGITHLGSAQVRKRLTMTRIFVLLSMAMLVPAVSGIGLYYLVNSEMGQRLSSESKFNDESAGARLLAWHVFEFMTPEELVLGMAPEHTNVITEKMSQSLDLVLIENPWILMFMHLGLIFYTVWFVMMVSFAGRLMYRTPPPLKMAVISYFAIASTNNSFAVKGSVHLLLIAAIICATRSLMQEEEEVHDAIAEPIYNERHGTDESPEARMAAIGQLISRGPGMEP